jgi:NAD(P) transhydrogenase subunit beta
VGNVLQLAYIGASTLFILSLKGLTHPRTAVRGNVLGACGMGLAVLAVMIDPRIAVYVPVALALGLGALVGVGLARRVATTSMPQLVAGFNGIGGLASALVALAAGASLSAADDVTGVTLVLATLIGAATFSGSAVALLKLEGYFKRVRLPFSWLLSAALLAACFGLGGMAIWRDVTWGLWAVGAVALLLGLFLVIPIGGADMPVVISLLNSYSGLAAGAAGFAIGNTALVVSGALVGASGLILTGVMCQAMNRSLWQVLFGAAPGASGTADDSEYTGVHTTSVEEAAMLLESASRVVIVPGYGMAVAQAQHAVRDVYRQLRNRGISVSFAIHPVAGRMPGHMNVLLAEADVPYEDLLELEEANPEMPQVDVAVVIGANDIVNPSASEASGSPLSGMPILEVHRARTVIVIKRSLSPGFAGCKNPLFEADNTVMLYEDGKAAMTAIGRELD